VPAALTTLRRWREELRGPGVLTLAWVLAHRPRADVHFTPEQPHVRHLAWKLARLNRLRVVARPTPRTVATVHFHDATTTAGTPGAVNGACTDVSKSRVDAAAARAFGRALAVDPRTHRGPLVRKSEANATHDGTLLHGPLTHALPGHVYQRLIDTERDGLVEDLRLCVVGGRVVAAFRKRRPAGDRFGAGATHVELTDPDSVTNDHERRAIAATLAGLGADLADVDCLRDARDGRLWVVDVNPTPWGLSPALDARTTRRALRLLANAWAEVLRDARRTSVHSA
jgi:hypothetical protein